MADGIFAKLFGGGQHQAQTIYDATTTEDGMGVVYKAHDPVKFNGMAYEVSKTGKAQFDKDLSRLANTPNATITVDTPDGGQVQYPLTHDLAKGAQIKAQLMLEGHTSEAADNALKALGKSEGKYYLYQQPVKKLFITDSKGKTIQGPKGPVEAKGKPAGEQKKPMAKTATAS
jgi:hypothetical protein